MVESRVLFARFQGPGLPALVDYDDVGLGTHYDIFESWDQALIGQLFYGSLLQIIPGGLLGSLTLAIRRARTA